MGAALACALALLLWGCLPPAAHAQVPGAFATAPSPALGMQSGASRQAWAAAAALSRGIGLVADRGSWYLATDGGAPLSAIGQGHFRTVRLWVPLSSLRSATPSARSADAFLPSLDQTVDAFLAQGLYVVLSVRDDAPRPPAGPQARERVAGAVDSGHAQVVQAWQQLSRRYAGRSSRLLFEMAFAPGAASALKNAQLPALWGAMRQRNPTRVLVVAWDDAIGLPQLVLPRDTHLIVGILHAEPFRFTRQGHGASPQAAQWRGTTCCSGPERQLMALPLNLAKAWSDEQRFPVWIAGFASHRSIAPELRARHARLVRNAAEERGLPWAYGDSDPEFAIGDAAARRWDAAMVQALTGR